MSIDFLHTQTIIISGLFHKDHFYSFNMITHGHFDLHCLIISDDEHFSCFHLANNMGFFVCLFVWFEKCLALLIFDSVVCIFIAEVWKYFLTLLYVWLCCMYTTGHLWFGDSLFNIVEYCSLDRTEYEIFSVYWHCLSFQLILL